MVDAMPIRMLGLAAKSEAIGGEIRVTIGVLPIFDLVWTYPINCHKNLAVVNDTAVGG